MNYPDSVEFLYALGNEIKTAKFGLDRIQTTLAALGNPQDRLRFIHVAGTNGKGSTCAMIESGLRAAGRRTGLFTSPHLAEPTERIRIDGVAVSAAQFAGAFDRVHACVEKLAAEGAVDWHTTYFETVTAMAFLIFLDERVDDVVLEVGLGGRLDATNVVTPALSVITQVDFDHEAYLGKSLESIAGEKAGILKRGVPAVFSRQRAEAARVLDARAAELSVPVTRTESWRIEDLELDARGSRFHLTGDREFDLTGDRGFRLTGNRGLDLTGDRDFDLTGNRGLDLTGNRGLDLTGNRGLDLTSDRDLHLTGDRDFHLTGNRALRIACPLAGEHQVENAATAAIALARAGIADDAIERGIAQAQWPGRLERVSEDPEIVLDGAHNPAGARALASYLDRFYSHRRVRLIYGAMRDKAVEEIGGILFPRAAQVIVTAPKQARALAPETIREIATHPDLRTAATLEDALALVRDASPADAIFITGSLFLVAEARAIIGHKG